MHYWIMDVTAEERAKADSDPSYSPAEVCVGRLDAETEREALRKCPRGKQLRKGWDL